MSCWPFVAVVFLPLSFDALNARGIPTLLVWTIKVAAYIVVPVILVDSFFYGEWGVFVLNWKHLGRGGSTQGSTRAQQRCRDCRLGSAGWFSQTPHGQNGASPPPGACLGAPAPLQIWPWAGRTTRNALLLAGITAPLTPGHFFAANAAGFKALLAE